MEIQTRKTKKDKNRKGWTRGESNLTGDICYSLGLPSRPGIFTTLDYSYIKRDDLQREEDTTHQQNEVLLDRNSVEMFKVYL